MVRMTISVRISAAIFFAAFSVTAQTNATGSTASAAAFARGNISTLELSEQLRVRCIAERRSVCGKILRIFPDGILVESGYTNLLHEPLTKSWLVPGSVVASRAENLAESREPGALCFGTVFLADLPRGKPHQYDYVILAGYPTGEFTYNSVGTIQKTIRRFSANLDKAVKANLDTAEQHAAK